MNLSVKSRKTGKCYNVLLAGNDKRLILRLYTLLGLTGSLFALTLMSFFAFSTQGRVYSQEVFLAFSFATLIVGKRAHSTLRQAKAMLDVLIAKHESEHPQE
jgi:hypothetical protein